jgi:chromosome segregation ATPase
LPVFRYNEALDVVQNVKAFLSEKKSKRQEFKRLRDDIENKRREFFQLQSQLAAAKDRADRFEFKKRKKRIEQEIFELKRELHTAEERAKGTQDKRSAPQPTGELWLVVEQRRSRGWLVFRITKQFLYALR